MTKSNHCIDCQIEIEGNDWRCGFCQSRKEEIEMNKDTKLEAAKKYIIEKNYTQDEIFYFLNKTEEFIWKVKMIVNTTVLGTGLTEEEIEQNILLGDPKKIISSLLKTFREIRELIIYEGFEAGGAAILVTEKILNELLRKFLLAYENEDEIAHNIFIPLFVKLCEDVKNEFKKLDDMNDLSKLNKELI